MKIGWLQIDSLRLGILVLLVSGALAFNAKSYARASANEGASAADLAARILDESQEGSVREALIGKHPELSAELVQAMSRGLGGDAKEEYRRIPWIWRVAIAAGRRNDEGELRRLLLVSLPDEQGTMADWQAVVLGGGLINGITQAGAWPTARLEGVLRGTPKLPARWRHALALASEMADDERVPTGTRYDALRIIGMESWNRCGSQLFRYLLKDVHPELQQGAICALGDMPFPAVPQALLSGLEHYSEGNRRFAIEALLRDENRRGALLDALSAGRLKRADLGKDVEEKLTDPSQTQSSDRAKAILAK